MLCFQVDAAKVTIGSSWNPILAEAVATVAKALDITSDTSANAAGSVEARLYKLLLYREGGHFAAHKDTEKEAGMLGTLVVQLPCAGGHQGGRLMVRHKGETLQHDFAQVRRGEGGGGSEGGGLG